MRKSNSAEQKECAKVNSLVVTRVHEGRKGLVFFDMILNDVYVNGMSVVAGEKGDFLSFPSHKGKDGNWYNYAWVRLSDEDVRKILDMVQMKLDE